MKTVKVNLNSINKVKDFVAKVTKTDFELDLVSGRHNIDAKSIMGIFSLDLSKPVELHINSTEKAAVDKLLDSISDYIVE